MCNCVFSETLCNFRSRVWPVGSMSSISLWLHICGIGLYVVMRTYIWRWSGYFESVGLCLCIWVSSWLGVLWVPCVKCGVNKFSRWAYARFE